MPPTLALQVLERPTTRKGQDLIQAIGFKGGLGQSWEPAILNRVVTPNSDDFVHISFADLAVQGIQSASYIEEILTKGIKIGNRLFLYYGHSNSQLKARSCFLIAADTLSESSTRINKLGNFSAINEVGKRAKRIGLLFSSSEHMFHLDENYTTEIKDVERNGQTFTDGCGIISEEFATEIKAKYLTRRNKSAANIPSVFQIRYKGYKGILMVVKKNNFDEIYRVRQVKPSFFQMLLDPFTSWFNLSNIETPKKKVKVIFRPSMRKFTGCPLNDFCILDYSKPLAGKLNGELICILSTLGISDEVFLKKQNEYFAFIRNASRDLKTAKQFLEYRGCHDLVNKLKDHPSIDAAPGWIIGQINKHQREEKESFDKYDLEKIRIRIPKSRLLLGVCDISGKLEEGQCYVNISSADGSNTKILKGPLVVGRNPCLYPGDIQKFMAMSDIPELEHLQDCIVFSTKGDISPASNMSGGDLDGDKFFVCWDDDLRPPKFETPLDYSALAPNPHAENHKISELDMIKYFAHYSTSLGKVMELYWAWIRASPRQRAGSKQCRFLTKLYCKCVDGERISIPSWLKNPPRPDISQQFILDKLKNNLRFNFYQNLESPTTTEENEFTENEQDDEIVEIIGNQRDETHSKKIGQFIAAPFVWILFTIWSLVEAVTNLQLFILGKAFVALIYIFRFIKFGTRTRQDQRDNREQRKHNRDNESNNRARRTPRVRTEESWIWKIFNKRSFEKKRKKFYRAACLTMCMIVLLLWIKNINDPVQRKVGYILLIISVIIVFEHDPNAAWVDRLIY